MVESMLAVDVVEVGRLLSNSYLVYDRDTGDAVIIDAGDEAEKILRLIQRHRVQVKAIYATHCHFDHVLAVREVKEVTGCKFYIHRDDFPLLESSAEEARKLLGVRYPPPPKPDGFVEDGDRISVGAEVLEVIHTPGHSPGSVCYLSGRMVFTGDTLFAGSIGRSDLSGGDLEKLLDSILNKLFKLPDDTAVYPGHGPSTTIGAEKLYNIYVGEGGLLRR